jgi:hypothetical protein
VRSVGLEMSPPPARPLEAFRSPRRSALRSTLAVAGFECARIVQALKARWLLCGLFLMAALPSLVAIFRGGPDHTTVADGRARAASLIKFYGMDGARALFGCPKVILSLGLTTFFLVPLATLVLTYDCVAEEIESDTGRLLWIRASRPSLVAGKAIAHWAVFCAAILIGHAVVSIAEVASGAAGTAVVLRCGLLFAVSACVMAAAYVSFWVLVSSVARTRKGAFWGASGVAFALAIVRGLFHERVPTLETYMPGALDRLLLSARTSHRWEALGMTLAWSLAALATATRVLARRDV